MMTNNNNAIELVSTEKRSDLEVFVKNITNQSHSKGKNKVPTQDYNLANG